MFTFDLHEESFQLQQDITGYTPPHKQAIIGIASDNVDLALAKILRVVAAEYCTLPWGSISCGFACSDHWSCMAQGRLPSVEYVKLVLAVALELGMEK
ncbi:Leucine aminopeptidase 1 [Geranomyces variabilis]|uniref:Leucine aminopeptidase 1 n=1 Tax=Geranomyces variabilis TaxID=109894 RepID=A0AAD5TM31_9FUNG|nr:Leucine aminopeptidase 1 [Geranomyces variabilis]